MRIMNIDEHDCVNSITGYTLSIFFAGCAHHCEGCFNKESWNYNNGSSVTVSDLKLAIKKNVHNNVSFLGGDPLFHKNVDDVLELLKYCKYLGKTTYLWTGYLKEQVREDILEYVDYLIDGKFEQSKFGAYRLRGSSNQVVYYKGKVLQIN